MKALTLWQPWASLVAVGRKRIETRSWSTSYRGPLAIHAAVRRPLDGECSGRVEWNQVSEDVDGAGWIYWLDEPWSEEAQAAAGAADCAGDLVGFPLPLGAVVATCNLVDVAPMGGPYAFSTGLVEGAEVPFVHQHVLVVHPDGCLALDHPSGCSHRCGTFEDVSDQAPFGDFAPGRYAWLLEDIEPVVPAPPARGRQGLWEL